VCAPTVILDLIKSSILPALRAGKDVILDRFWWSTWVYGKVSGVDHDSLEAMRRLELSSWSGILPYLLFLIHRSNPINRNEPLDLWNRLAAEYRLLAKEEEEKYPVRLIKNEGSVTDSVEQIVLLIRSRKDTQAHS